MNQFYLWQVSNEHKDLQKKETENQPKGSHKADEHIIPFLQSQGWPRAVEPQGWHGPQLDPNHTRQQRLPRFPAAALDRAYSWESPDVKFPSCKRQGWYENAYLKGPSLWTRGLKAWTSLSHSKDFFECGQAGKSPRDLAQWPQHPPGPPLPPRATDCPANRDDSTTTQCPFEIPSLEETPTPPEDTSWPRWVIAGLLITQLSPQWPQMFPKVKPAQKRQSSLVPKDSKRKSSAGNVKSSTDCFEWWHHCGQWNSSFQRGRKGQGLLLRQWWLVDAAGPESSVLRTVASTGIFHSSGHSPPGCCPISGHRRHAMGWRARHSGLSPPADWSVLLENCWPQCQERTGQHRQAQSSYPPHGTSTGRPGAKVRSLQITQSLSLQGGQKWGHR